MRLLLILSFLLMTPVVATAAEHLALLGVGGYNVQRTDQRSVEYRLEYSGRQQYKGFGTQFGINANGDNMLYFFGGINYEYIFSNGLYVSPNLSAGIYRRGDSKDLGGPIEFRSVLEVGYRFDNGMRLGAAVSHLSNASIYDQNPGSESVVGVFAFPLW
jgi:lipid A 3-O-deacylase